MKPTEYITKWEPREDNGTPLLVMPNVPLPLHLLAPRTIMGSYEWGKIRKQCYEDAGDICEICGIKLGSKLGEPNMHQAHELYTYDYKTYTAEFIRPIVICPRCHNFTHSGRALTCYLNHEPLWDKTYMLGLAEHGFGLVHNWNKLHPDDEPLRVYETYLDWLKEPSLHDDLLDLIRHYEIEFYGAKNRSDWENAWGKWKLIYNGTEYYSPYNSREEWEEATKSQHDDGKNLFDEKQMEELSKLEDDIFNV